MISLPDAPWIDCYDKYRGRYYQTIGDDEMSGLWAYEPEKCDGDFCPMNCDICGKKYDDLEGEEEEDD